MIIENNIECTGCGMCEVICPSKSLKIRLTGNGFFKPFQVNDSCIKCGLCEKICPALDGFSDFDKPISTFSAYSKDNDVRKSCSSGGIAHEIGKLMLNNGYGICGVAYDTDKEMARHIICDDEMSLENIKGSKYIQSYTVDAFSEMINNLKDRKYLVYGTPCQIAAIDKYAQLMSKRENLILIDFFCHGTPTYLLWKKYIKQIKNKYKLNDFKAVRFRDKKYGWHSFTIAVETDDRIFYSDKIRDKDIFYELFLGNYCLNKACYKCKFRSINSKADIRVGDLWGRKYSKDKEGISAVITFTNSGEKTINKLNEVCNVKHEPLEVVLEGQIKNKIDIPKVRNSILIDLKNKKSLKHVYNTRIIPFKILRKLKRVLNKMMEV